MPLSSQTARTVVLTGLSKFTSSLLKVGKMEAAKVWNRCRDAPQSAMKERTQWPTVSGVMILTVFAFTRYPRAVRFNRGYLLDVNDLVALLDARRLAAVIIVAIALAISRPRLAEPQHRRPVRQEQAHDDPQGTRCIEPPKRAIHFPSAGK